MGHAFLQVQSGNALQVIAYGLRVLLTLSRSDLRDLTEARCAVSAFLTRLSVFFCRFSAVRILSSRRSTARSTFCAAATLAAGGVAEDRLPPAPRLAAAGLELCDRV